MNICSVACSSRGSDSGVDCKTARIFSYSSRREQSNKLKLWNEAENRERCEARALRPRKTLTPRFTDFFTDFEKKARLFCSLINSGEGMKRREAE